MFDVEQDPSEAYPLPWQGLPSGLLDKVNQAREDHKNSFTIAAIDPRFGNLDFFLTFFRLLPLHMLTHLIK